MRVTRIERSEIDIDLAFRAPFKSSSKVQFRPYEAGPSTKLVWTTVSPQNVMARIMRILINMDKLIGSDLDNGLSNLRDTIETRRPSSGALDS